ncbi:MAG: SURF1 family protein [Sandaracinobacteroides sp.]
MVAIAVPTMVGFGIWQLQRMQWKDALLAELATNSRLPLAELAEGPIPADAQFRLVRLQLDCPGGGSERRAGRNLRGQPGYSHRALCRAGQQTVRVDAGWTLRPDPVPLPAVNGPVEGRLVQGPEGIWMLVAVSARPPLQPSAPPGLDTISNNHLSYAIQWFSFATILAVIYALWLRRRLATPGVRA